ncbi:hypothetical protein [Aporhodopirellula aestuarii]|uniref:Uncharacterized protein n=1 Tax=Aporhodopirellula aestuarii TaxID=2950107 RepID=A0ABT0TYX6_9BACT|nr:hypothetical protein [Aporhodopirellula aestuarii]MCM2369809.1 hypothetical protein [Aporhodopirellula aestuarii]
MDAPTGIGTMNKDVKRALILWPAICSTAIVAATTLPLCWEAQPHSSRSHSITIDSSTLARVVRIAHQLLSPSEQSDSTSRHHENLLSDQFGGDKMARSLQDVAPAHRPDRGKRGLAMPQRLAGNLAGDTMATQARNLNGEQGNSSVPADLEASNQVIARTLLAPVLDPVAELAGYSGLATPMPSKADPTAGSTVPSILSPGVEDPYAATRSTFSAGINSVAGWKSSANDTPGESADERSQTLIPRNVEFLAKPSREPHCVQTRTASDTRSASANLRPATLAGNPVTWPQPKQLCQDLALIASDADMLRMLNRHNGIATLTSFDKPSSETVRELVADGNRQFDADETTTALQRQATAVVMGRWANQVESTLDELRSLPRIGDTRSGKLIRKLASLSEAGLQLAERVPARDQQVRWLRASHALSRRAAVWGPIWQLARQSTDANTSEQPPVAQNSVAQNPVAQNPVVTSVPGERLFTNANGYSLVHFHNEAPEIGDHINSAVTRLRRELSETGDVAGWNTFLLLDEIEVAADSDDADARSLLAQRFLSRLDHHSLDGEHREWLQRDSIHALASLMQTWTAQPIDYARLLTDIERGETDSIDLAAIKVSEAFQSLRFSKELDAARVAKAIDVTYRNANVRTAISVDLIDRLLPPVEPRTEPIHTTLLGNQVRGTSTVNSQLSLQLRPARGSWSLAVAADGNVDTRSQSGRSGVTVLSNGHNVFRATTPLIIRPGGYQIGETHVDVSGSQRLSGIRSRYDGWPLLGSLVRGIAESRFQEALPIAERVSESQIRQQVSTELQTELTEKSRVAETKLDEFVFGPLARLNLDPKVIDLQTTPTRLVARYRLAGDWQLASNTPRPRAWSDSWMSLQIHQSALNNTMERLMPTGQSKTIEQFYTQTMELFGREAPPLPSDVPTEAMIEFAPTRPVTIEIDNGKLWLTLRVVSLSQGEGPSLRRFIVRAAYRPEIDGLDARLVRDGHLSISGPGMSMRQRIPIRAVFNKILTESRSIPITTPKLIENPAVSGLAISQLELRDGWLALAISPETSTRVAVGTRSVVNR